MFLTLEGCSFTFLYVVWLTLKHFRNFQSNLFLGHLQYTVKLQITGGPGGVQQKDCYTKHFVAIRLSAAMANEFAADNDPSVLVQLVDLEKLT